jgi:hypothetical protein
MVLVMIAGAAIGVVAWFVIGQPLTRRPVTEAQIEHEVALKPHGHVQVVLCNEEVLPGRKAESDPAHTWTCDTVPRADGGGRAERAELRGDRARRPHQVDPPGPDALATH